jgi:hypothetical protein
VWFFELVKPSPKKMYTNEKLFSVHTSSIHPSILCGAVVGGVSLRGYNFFGGGDQPYLLYTKKTS